jgi:hypothetical protein
VPLEPGHAEQQTEPGEGQQERGEDQRWSSGSVAGCGL